MRKRKLACETPKQRRELQGKQTACINKRLKIWKSMQNNGYNKSKQRVSGVVKFQAMNSKWIFANQTRDIITEKRFYSENIESKAKQAGKD